MASTEETVAKVAAFYAAQAHYYHRTYEHPLCDEKYLRLRQRYQQLFVGLDVLEIACGTGYWSGVVGSCANSVLATDINENLVQITRQHTSSLPNVRCQVASAYSLDGVTGPFSGAFAQHWLSHVPRRQLPDFLANFHSKLERGARVFFSDDTLYDHESLWRRTDEHGDIFESRLRPDGSREETIKNFQTRDELTALIEHVADDVQYEEYQPERLWTLTYRLR